MVPLNDRRTLLAACTMLGAFVATPAVAQDYYAGRTIDLVIGSGPAGGYDIYGRALARHINRHIPGKPNIVVKNMPGAGSA
jgi:tripartite-type tricarboxylate transporter receptor subunit TctC